MRSHGIEPVTFCVWGRRDNQLHHRWIWQWTCRTWNLFHICQYTQLVSLSIRSRRREVSEDILARENRQQKGKLAVTASQTAVQWLLTNDDRYMQTKHRWRMQVLINGISLASNIQAGLLLHSGRCRYLTSVQHANPVSVYVRPSALEDSVYPLTKRSSLRGDPRTNRQCISRRDAVSKEILARENKKRANSMSGNSRSNRIMSWMYYNQYTRPRCAAPGICRLGLPSAQRVAIQIRTTMV